MEEFKILKIKGDSKEEVVDLIAEEVPFTINVNKKELVTLLATPQDLKELSTGFLFTSGLINKYSEIENIIVDSQRWLADVTLVNDIDPETMVFKRLYTSGCGKGTMFYTAADIMHKQKNESQLKVRVEIIRELMGSFQKGSEIYLKTGGVHSAALCSKDKVVIFKEDIGRHNAIDKVVGEALANDIDLSKCFLLTSGRVSSEVLQKIKKANIPVLVSQSAPTNQAVKLANDLGITLCGFARGLRMNIYSNIHRIII